MFIDSMKRQNENPRERKQRGVYMLMFLVCLLGFTTFASAQYVVKSSDTLWGIAERNTEPKIAWQKIYDANAFLQQPGRRFEDGSGRTIVVIHEGEILNGVNSDGLVPFIDGSVIAPSPSPSPTPAPVSNEPYWFEKIPWWLWLLLLAIPASILFGFLLNWLYRQSPTEWRPIIRGGIPPDNNVELWMNEHAYLRGATVITGSVRKVRLYGVWGTKHRGVPFSVPHRYNGERAYVARFRMKNGVERDGVMLQGCGNDVASGTWYTEYPGARIEKGWGDENSSDPKPPTPTPTPATPTRDQQMAVPTTEIVPVKTPSLRSGRDSDLHGEDEPVVVKGPAPVAAVKKPTEKFISFASSDKNGPSMIRWNGIDVHSMHIGPDGTKTLRFTQNEE